MEVGNLTAKVRSTVGTGEARKLRQLGMIPAICYGAGQDTVQLQINPTELQKALDPKKGRNTLLKLHIEGQAAESVLLKDAQHTKLRGDLVHADFLRVKLDKPVRATVPLLLTGKSEGVKAGGIMHQVYRRIDLLALPERIPEHIEIDVTNLGMMQSIHVSDLKLPEGTKAALAANTTLCVVTAPKADKVADAAAETAAEGAADAAAAGKAPAGKAPAGKAPDAKAAGDKGGDKAAAKPAGGKK